MSPHDAAALWEDQALGELLASVCLSILVILMCLWQYRRESRRHEEKSITEALREAYKLPVIRDRDGL